MNRKIFFAIFLCIFCTLAVLTTLGAGQFFRVRGFFQPDDTWTGGHPGKVSFDIGASNNDFVTTIDTSGYLSGVFWLGNVGWANFFHQISGVERARVICPDTVFRDVSAVCPITGYAWSQNAGWISFSGSMIGQGSGVYYNPSTGVIEGFAHSQALGYVPFYASASSLIASGSVDQTGIILEGIGVNFIGKIAIIGNIAGTRIYNITNQNVGYIFNNVNQSEVLNTIRKNVAFITRNVPPNTGGVIETNDLMYRNDNHDIYIDNLSPDPFINHRTIIVEGSDVVLGKEEINLVSGAKKPPRAIIALKGSDGNGGNIIITSAVKRINAFLYAEGSIISGDKELASPVVPYVLSGAWNIPAQQLYIYGGLISKNTIGGSLQNPSICPIVINTCDVPTAQLYDLNYFRTYDYKDPSQKSIPYDDIRFEKSSTVIEYDQRITEDPPPGLESVIQ